MGDITFPSRVVSQECFKERLGEGIADLIRDRFNNDPAAALRHYDRNGDGLGPPEMERLVRDAGYRGGQRVAGGPGNAFNVRVSAEFAAEKMIEEIDGDGNGRVSLAEFVNGRQPPATGLPAPAGTTGVSLRGPR